MRVVDVEGETVPFLEIDTSGARAPGKDPLWAVTINGGRLSKVTANTGGTFGVRLTAEASSTPFMVTIWVEEMSDGTRTMEPIDVEMAR